MEEFDHISMCAAHELEYPHLDTNHESMHPHASIGFVRTRPRCLMRTRWGEGRGRKWGGGGSSRREKKGCGKRGQWNSVPHGVRAALFLLLRLPLTRVRGRGVLSSPAPPRIVTRALSLSFPILHSFSIHYIIPFSNNYSLFSLSFTNPLFSLRFSN